MTNYVLIAVISYSIVIAAIIGLVRLPRLPGTYQPFIFITILSLASEIISQILITHKKSNAVAVNMLGLFEAVLWCWQFKNWNTNQKYHLMLRVVVTALLILWIIENIILRKMFVFGYLFPIAFSLVMVILSGIQLSLEIARERGNLLTTPKFLICSGTVLFYTYRILVECFFAPGMSMSDIFFGNVFIILSLVNFIVNLLFALAVLWIPEKQKFSLPYY